MNNPSKNRRQAEPKDLMPRDGFSPDLPEQFRAGGSLSGLSLAMRFFDYMLSGIEVGTLDVTFENGSTRRYEGSQPGPHGALRIKHGGLLVRHVIKSGEVGFGEAFLDNCWDSPDLTRLLTVLYLNEPHYKGPFEWNWVGKLKGYLAHRRRANTKTKAKENIEFHYDLGNEFYKMWLDDTMAYSSGMFIQPNETLMDSQINKFRLIYERLDLRPEHTLLEIGSGWGGFAIYAAKHSGCRVHSITLSKEQLAEARLRAESAGLVDRISFELRDYRDVSETYDRIVSIEMYEAVGEEYWPAYFRAIAKALKPGGVAAIQGITISEKIFENYRSKRDFIQKYIFPGGMLCPPERFQSIAQAAGLAPSDLKFYAKDYADTLAHWHRNVLAVREQIVQQFDQRFLRMWRYYLSYCECGFLTGSIDLMHISLKKIN
jgi:cyclopropane-fatty-acyl-phospholipid synthase